MRRHAMRVHHPHMRLKLLAGGVAWTQLRLMLCQRLLADLRHARCYGRGVPITTVRIIAAW
jgi:hypothetical protein